jgi:sugar lactone lactonase YvrE
MTVRLMSIAVLALLPAGAEPPARKPAELPLRLDGATGAVSGAYELADGRILLTDAGRPAVSIVDPVSGRITPVGSAGAGEGQYVRPGGIYTGAKREALVLDRAQTRVNVYSAAGAFVRSYSIAVEGVTTNSTDSDLQRLDARGYSYFIDRDGLAGVGSGRPVLRLVRFEPVKQHKALVAELRGPETKTVAGGDGVTFSRSVVGSPADGWGVAPDGRVAVVRSDPYRVEWISVDGKVAQGPAIAIDAIPITDADKAAYKAKYGSAGGGVGVGVAGGRTGLSGLEPVFAATKAPFSPADVVVSPDAHVWVMRSRPAAATTVIYDVFDATGRRVDRLEFPERSRVVGFGANSVFISETGGDRLALRKYKVR